MIAFGVALLTPSKHSAILAVRQVTSCGDPAYAQVLFAFSEALTGASHGGKRISAWAAPHGRGAPFFPARVETGTRYRHARNSSLAVCPKLKWRRTRQ